MNSRQTRTLRTYDRIASTLPNTNPPLPAEALVVLERFTATIHDIQALVSEQHVVQASRPVTVARHHLECMRKDDLLPLNRLCVRLFAGETALLAALKVPHKRAPTEDLLDAATRMVKTLRPHRDTLLAARIDPARLDKIQAEVRRLRREFKEAYGAVADRAVPTRRLRELFQSAHVDVRILDAFCGIGAAPKELRDWNSLKKISKRMGRPKIKRQQKPSGEQAA